jgi:hypothetical protein
LVRKSQNLWSGDIGGHDLRHEKSRICEATVINVNVVVTMPRMGNKDATRDGNWIV